MIRPVCRTDIGGSAVPDTEKLALADVTLRWMVKQVVRAQCGIIFDSDALHAANIPDSVFTGPGFPVTPPPREKRWPGKQAGSSTGHGSNVSAGARPSSSDEDCEQPRPVGLDRQHAVQPLHDELRRAPLWWLLEVLPMSYNWQEPNGRWHTSWK